jgi:2-octaprenyl-6-methoxyphenol hydroxylase
VTNVIWFDGLCGKLWRMTFDAIIIGAGLNGLATALALGSPTLRRPVRVALIDFKNPQELARRSRDTRGSAVTPATKTMLATLGIWSAISQHSHEMRHIIVTDGQTKTLERPALLSFAIPVNEQAASIVENHAMFAAMLEAVEASPHITSHYGRKVSGFSYGPGLAKVTLDDGEEIKAQLIIGADGRNSLAREAAGLKVRSRSYGQTGITFTIRHEHSHGGQAEEHFTSDGVLAVLPLPGDRSSIVWAQSEASAEKMMGLDDAAFLAAFATKLGDQLGAITLAGPRAAYPLILQIADAFIAPRLALVGDAAHVIHPLAGLGLNLGFKDAAALSECVSDALALGQDIGSEAVLDSYMRMRRFDTVMTSLGMDGMNFLFANDNPLLKLTRDTGLKIINRLPAIKTLLMAEAAGSTGTPPRLMRGLR